MSYNDSLKQSLVSLGYTESIDDALNKFLQDRTDIVSTTTPDMMYAWLGGLGYTGSLPDRLQQHAVASGYSSHAAQVIAGAYLTRYVYNMDGIDDRWTLANRAINPYGDNTFEFFTGGNTNSTIIAQNISGTSTSREFQLYVGTAPSLVIIFGGSTTTLLTEAEGAKLNTKYFLNLTGSNYTIAEGISSNIIKNGAFIRGAAREPSAPTIIGARQNGAGSFAAYLTGLQRDIKINGVLWPMADRNQSIQLPEPSGLGAELITKAVLENPATKGSQWTYLGNGRWQYVGDGTLNELRFIPQVSQPAQGFLQFDVEQVTGDMTCTNDVLSGSIFNTIGVKRFFYLTNNVSAGITFKRVAGSGSMASCIIKNISFKPLGTCNPMTGANLNPDRWTEIPV